MRTKQPHQLTEDDLIMYDRELDGSQGRDRAMLRVVLIDLHGSSVVVEGIDQVTGKAEFTSLARSATVWTDRPEVIEFDGGRVEVSLAQYRTKDGQPLWRYVIQDGTRTLDDSTGEFGRHHNQRSASVAMRSLLSGLVSEAHRLQNELEQPAAPLDPKPMFAPGVARWALDHVADLDTARIELVEPLGL